MLQGNQDHVEDLIDMNVDEPVLDLPRGLVTSYEETQDPTFDHQADPVKLKPGRKASTGPKERPADLTAANSSIYSAVYSGVQVYEMMCRNVATMRRKTDSYLNATQILKVANIDKGRRTKILEKEIQNGPHEKVQGGYGKYQGTWIPFERGLQLAQEFEVDGLLETLLSTEAPVESFDKGTYRKSIKRPDPTREIKRKRYSQFDQDHHYHSNNPYIPHEFVHYQYSPGREVDPFVETRMLPPSTSARHASSMVAMLISESPSFVPDFLNGSNEVPCDFVVDTPLDSNGHTGLHWSAAFGRVPLLRSFLLRGADIEAKSVTGETALMRSVVHPNNFEHQTFTEVLSLLYRLLPRVDNQKRSVFHHVALASKNKLTVQSSRYYMECLLEFVARYEKDCLQRGRTNLMEHEADFTFTSLVNLVDVEGNTALNLAAKNGNRSLVQQLLEVGADASIKNNYGLNSMDYLDGHGSIPRPETRVVEPKNPGSTVVYPSIQSADEIARVSPVVFVDKDSMASINVQLKDMAHEMRELRKENLALKSQTSQIPDLQFKIKNYEETLLRVNTSVVPQSLPRSFSNNPAELVSLLNALHNDIATKETKEARLRQEMLVLQSNCIEKELKYKRIIASCCNIHMDHVDDILSSLLEAVESDGPDLDMSVVAGFMTRVRHQQDSV